MAKVLATSRAMPPNAEGLPDIEIDARDVSTSLGAASANGSRNFGSMVCIHAARRKARDRP
jgi:hypothetical protein